MFGSTVIVNDFTVIEAKRDGITVGLAILVPKRSFLISTLGV